MIWIAFALLAFGTFLFLSRSFSFVQKSNDTRVSQTYGKQLDEIERDLDMGLLSAHEAASAKAGLERKLARSLRDAQTEPPPQTKHNTLQMLLAGTLLLGSLGIYLRVGKPQLAPSPIAVVDRPMLSVEQNEMIDGMIKSLAQKLADNPDNLEGWKLLMRSLQVKQGDDAAKQAHQQAQKVFSEQPEKLTDLNKFANELNLR